MNAAQLRICVQRLGAAQCIAVQVAECQGARRRYLPQALHTAHWPVHFHTGNNTIKCNNCENTFSQVNNLKKHEMKYSLTCYCLSCIQFNVNQNQNCAANLTYQKSSDIQWHELKRAWNGLKVQ